MRPDDDGDDVSFSSECVQFVIVGRPRSAARTECAALAYAAGDLAVSAVPFRTTPQTVSEQG